MSLGRIYPYPRSPLGGFFVNNVVCQSNHFCKEIVLKSGNTEKQHSPQIGSLFVENINLFLDFFLNDDCSKTRPISHVYCDVSEMPKND